MGEMQDVLTWMAIATITRATAIWITSNRSASRRAVCALQAAVVPVPLVAAVVPAPLAAPREIQDVLTWMAIATITRATAIWITSNSSASRRAVCAAQAAVVLVPLAAVGSSAADSSGAGRWSADEAHLF